MLKALCFRSAFISFFLLLSFGNLSRFLSSPFFSDSLLVTEGLFYGSCLCSFLFLHFSPRTLVFLSALFLFLLASFSYGCFLHDFDLVALFYALRLFFLVFSVVVFVELCWHRFQGRRKPLFTFLFSAYFVALVLGLVLYFCFPSASVLWALLSAWHIGFQGDPHVGRFLSVYLDPNYYAALSGFMVLVSSYLASTTGKRRYRLGAFAFFTTGVLAWSRSGMATLFLLLLYPLFFDVIRGRFSVKKLRGLFGFTLFSLTFFLWQGRELEQFLARSLSLSDDPSALCRLDTFRLGVDLWRQEPFWGVGTNFLYRYAKEEVSLQSLDSSLFSLLLQVGSLPFLVLLFLVGLFCLTLPKYCASWKKKEEKSSLFLSWFLFYLITCVLFTSQFNNLLFYPFFFLPVFSTLIYCLRSIGMTDETCYVTTHLDQGGGKRDEVGQVRPVL